ncbi:MAG TPA: M48 family metalloprotease [Dehalococcoidales bacterium]|nr:M48 family metalloprotease [Dehalococcoidales bacterium]
MLFFISFWGHYFTQAVVYSIVTLAVVETLVAAWRLREALARIKLRFLALLLPVACPPLFFLIYPPRHDFSFREQVALLDINTWLRLELGGGIAVWHLAAAGLGITAIVFLARDVLPIVRHYLGRRHLSFPIVEEGRFPRLDAALAGLPEKAAIPRPAVRLSPDKLPVAYTSGRGTLVVSAAMIDLLDDDELRAVTGHEIAHLSRRVGWISRALLVLRWLQGYNPLAILVFHLIVNDSEKLCDDMAAGYSGRRLSLTSGLLKIFQRSTGETLPEVEIRRPVKPVNGLEDVANRNLVKERIKRIVHGDAAGVPYPNFRVVVTGVMLAALLFLIV